MFKLFRPWVLVALFLLLAKFALAATPLANSVIGNQASATYTDATGQTKSATSNLVETTVRQVGSLTLVQDNSKAAAVGNTVYMPHTLTNTGNGADSFVLSTSDIVAATDTDFATNISIYADANGDGVPDSTTPLCTGLGCTFTTASLPPGGAFNFVVSMTVPATATAAQFDQILVTATGSTLALYDGNNNGIFGEAGDNVRTNTDTLTVTALAAFQVNKSISTSQGPTGAVVTYTLTYSNIGAAAGNLALSDVIGSGATIGLAYVPGSAIWSAGATVLTDAYVVGTPDATVGGSQMHYQALIAGALTTVRATVTNVAPNVTGTVTFQVNVLPTATVGTATTTNAASYGLDADSDPTNNTLTQQSNPVTYNVLATYALVVNDGTAAALDGTNVRPLVADTDAVANADLSYVATATPGQTVTFNATVWNQGNTTDTFNITAATLAGGGGFGTWPAGTTIQLFKADGATPLTDSGADGVADTGPLTNGASYVVVVKVTLPPSACSPVCPTGPFDVQVTGKSVGNPALTNTTFERLGALVAPTVDLANSTGAVNPAVNQDPVVVGSPTVTLAPAPGAAAVFDLFVRNEGGVADTYALAYSGTNAFTPATPLPAGWTLQFRTAVAGVCSATGGSVISSVGPIAAGAEQKVCAIVIPAVGALAGNTDVYFQVVSGVSGASDTVLDRVTISQINALTIQPSHTGQVFPGGTVVYPYTLVNSGNTSCGATTTFTMNEALAAQGWTFVLYRDNNGDGLIDAGDTVVDPLVGLTSTTLAPGGSAKLLVKVFAPAGAASGTTDVVSITANSTCGTAATTSNTATGTTTVITGQVRLVKQQAIDHDCDGVPSLRVGVSPGFSTANAQAFPGECVLYKVTATNEGLGNVIALTISDTLPVFTLFSAGPVCSTGTATYTAPTFSCSAITLAPSLSATMDFRVRVQP
jgi:uncharacterized repeat protein (TIGR01451 family)